ncbi:MAG: glycerophosphodiester phosphodiesterase [Omnitrophica WOR_2 bacterium]
MPSLYYDLPRPIVFAHRGSSLHAPENTLAAFELALQQGANAIELDAKLTADGQVIVIHDFTVDRTTDGTGEVRKLTLEQIRKLDAGSHFDIAYHNEHVPTLEEVFKAVGSRTLINIELTNYAAPLDALPEKVVRLVRRYRLESRVLFSSFCFLTLLRAHNAMPGVPTGLLAYRGKAGILARSPAASLFPYQALHPEKSDVTGALVQRAHRQGRRIHVWTVDDPGEMAFLADLGVDGFFTDDPVLARKVLAGKTE